MKKLTKMEIIKRESEIEGMKRALSYLEDLKKFEYDSDMNFKLLDKLIWQEETVLRHESR